MTRRYFYDCPMKAAWMSTHHGIRYVDDLPEGQQHCFQIVGVTHGFAPGNPYEMIVPFRGDRKFYLHRDSLYQLEPQIDDEGVDADCAQCRYIDDYDPPGWFIDGVPVTSFDRATEPVKIDKRNDIPFMWPESEDA